MKTIKDLKDDIRNGTIKKLKMVSIGNYEIDLSHIEENKDAQMFNVERPISFYNDDYFTLETRLNNGSLINVEAYYNAFSFYDGNKLMSNTITYLVC